MDSPPIRLQIAAGENDIKASFAKAQNQSLVSIEYNNISPADFWIGPIEHPQFIMIERKTFDDFQSSLTSGHLRQQRERMREELENGKTSHIGFIVEGEPRYRKNQYRRLDGALENLIFKHRCFVLYSASIDHTRDIVLDICGKIPDYTKKEGWTKPAFEPIGLKKHTLSLPDYPTSVLALIPGISHASAAYILSQTDATLTLKRLSNMSVDELAQMSISKKSVLGQKKAKLCLQWLGMLFQ